jgi:hypothetical protein
MDATLHRIALVASLACGVVAGCFSIGDQSSSSAQGCDCTDPGPMPAHATAGKTEMGCPAWACDPGFVQCAGAPACGTDILNDPRNCGICGNDCLGEPCAEGTCHPATVLATGLPEDVLAMAADGTFVYLATASTGIVRVPEAGGAFEMFAPLSSGLSDHAFAADATGVYWISDGNLVTATAPAEAPAVVTPLDQGAIVMGPLLLDAAFVYWMTLLETDVPDGGSANGNVWRAPKAGGAAELLAPIAGLQVYASAPLATHEGSVAFVDVTEIRVVTLGGAASTVAEQAPGVATLAADDQSIYWIAGPAPQLGSCFNFGFGADAGCPAPPAGPDGIFAVDWAGGAVRTVSGTGELASLQALGGSLWGVGPAGTTLERVDVAGGAHAFFAGGGFISGFVLDATRVFWMRDDTLLASPQ